ncbi:MAG TPA: hypothetical protein VG318_00270 [Actinomycetota bacterium]|nr:hypothetical protein [Actinomycetota bacterium]
MSRHLRERRPNLATIVGSSLAAVAAGSLLAFSSLAEQAGLQGLATGRIEPAAPARGGGTRAIRLPAPAVAPGEPGDPIEQIVRETFARADAPAVPAPAPRVTPGAPADDGPPEKKEKKEKPRRRAPEPPPEVVAFTPREAADETETADGPPYGNAYGHDKHDNHGKKPKPAKPPKHAGNGKGHGRKADPAPIYARGAAEESSKPKDEPTTWKPVKEKKGAGHSNGKANGHSKHAHDNGNGGGKGKGHKKHGH